jgi:hypothetical protein
MSKSLVSFVGLMLLAIVTAGSDAAAQQLVRVGYSGVGNFIRTLSARLAHPKMTD